MGNYLNKFKREKQNEPQNDFIQESSLQLIHEPIIISANGFFNIDYDLLGSVTKINIKLFGHASARINEYCEIEILDGRRNDNISGYINPVRIE